MGVVGGVGGLWLEPEHGEKERFRSESPVTRFVYKHTVYVYMNVVSHLQGVCGVHQREETLPQHHALPPGGGSCNVIGCE